VSQLELLDARRNEQLNRRQAQRVASSQRQTTVRLIRALGGGWGAAPLKPLAPVQVSANAETTL
jgi:multidrug efflux system outer membrane protein